MKEPVNTWTHLIPFVAAIIGLVVVVIRSWSDTARLVTGTIYVASIVLLFGISSLYHWLRVSPKVQLFLRRLDHIAIYVMIAGSYTPVLYYGLDGAWRTAMLSVVWGLAGIGILLKLWFIHAPRWLSVLFYLGLGWMALIPLFQLVRRFPVQALILMVLGGVSYSLGALIYARKKVFFVPKPHGFHEVFHVLVALGSALHFVMVVRYVLPS